MASLRELQFAFAFRCVFKQIGVPRFRDFCFRRSSFGVWGFSFFFGCLCFDAVSGLSGFQISSRIFHVFGASRIEVFGRGGGAGSGCKRSPAGFRHVEVSVKFWRGHGCQAVMYSWDFRISGSLSSGLQVLLRTGWVFSISCFCIYSSVWLSCPYGPKDCSVHFFMPSRLQASRPSSL